MDEGVKEPFYTKLSGVTYKNDDGESRQTIIHRFGRPGKKLRFVREPNNKFSPKAIAVYIGEFQIGYIQDFLTEDLAPQMDQGYVVTGIIKDVTGGGDRNYGVNIEIFVKDPGESFEELEVKPETGFMNKLFSLFKKG
jgi:single-stranded-DNA-specific exonuclease